MPNLPDPAAARNFLTDRVYQHVFFNNLESLGYPIHTEKQARELLDMAAQLRNIPEEKTAGDSPSFYGQALSALGHTLGEYGLDGHIKAAAAQERELAVKAAAHQLAQDPDYYNSILSLRAEAAAYSQYPESA